MLAECRPVFYQELYSGEKQLKRPQKNILTLEKYERWPVAWSGYLMWKAVDIVGTWHTSNEHLQCPLPRISLALWYAWQISLLFQSSGKMAVGLNAVTMKSDIADCRGMTTKLPFLHAVFDLNECSKSTDCVVSKFLLSHRPGLIKKHSFVLLWSSLKNSVQGSISKVHQRGNKIQQLPKYPRFNRGLTVIMTKKSRLKAPPYEISDILDIMWLLCVASSFPI